MDHSLVVMAHKLCWRIEDVAYFKMKSSGKKRGNMAPERAAKIDGLDWMGTRSLIPPLYCAMGKISTLCT